jgi:hypothetical protein
MFLKPKKGNLSATFLVLIIIAVIMIMMVSGFGARIWKAFFPSDDKSTMKSFDAIHTMLLTKTSSQKDYDSTTMNIYLKDPYRIVIFDEDEFWCMNVGSKVFAYTAPKDCEEGKICLCLYEDKPSTEDKDGKTNLIKCYNLENKNNLIIDRPRIDIDKMICSDSLDGYGSFMFIKRTIFHPKTESYLYILKANENNKELDDEWSIPVCKTTESKDLCFQKKAGDRIEATDNSVLSEILVYCKQQNKDYKSAEVECTYDPSSKNNCFANCEPYDVSKLCGVEYKTCEDYNQLKKRMGLESDSEITYTSIDDDLTKYRMCENEVAFCNVNSDLGCEINTWPVYTCKDSDSGSVDPMNENCNLQILDEKGLRIDCNIAYLEDLEDKIFLDNNQNYMSFITRYSPKDECITYMKEHFYEEPTTIKACKQGMEEECQKFIKGKKNTLTSLIGDQYECELKFIKYNQEYLLTHYSSEEKCKTEINDLFTEVSICKTPLNVLEQEVTVS